VADIVNIMDFGADETAPEFNVHEHHFVCVEDIPLGIMQKVAQFKNLQKTLTETGNMEPILELMDQLLDDRSAALFRKCVDEKIIGVRRIMKIIPWVMEEFGLGHPTQPSLPSSSGQSDDGTGATSEDGLSPEARIPVYVQRDLPST
jgi:hypothetical protein